MVAEGDTVPVETVPLKPVFADQVYEVGAGVQLAVRVDVAPDMIEAGTAAKVQVGALGTVLLMEKLAVTL